MTFDRHNSATLNPTGDVEPEVERGQITEAEFHAEAEKR